MSYMRLMMSNAWWAFGGHALWIRFMSKLYECVHCLGSLSTPCTRQAHQVRHSYYMVYYEESILKALHLQGEQHHFFTIHLTSSSSACGGVVSSRVHSSPVKLEASVAAFWEPSTPNGKNHMLFMLYLRSSHWSPGVVFLRLIHTSPVCSRNDCLAFVSKNCATNTQQLLCRISLIGNPNTSNIEISMLWVGLVKTLDAFSMSADSTVVLLFYELCG